MTTFLNRYYSHCQQLFQSPWSCQRLWRGAPGWGTYRNMHPDSQPARCPQHRSGSASLPLKQLLHSLRPRHLPWDVSLGVCSTFHQPVLETAAMTNSSVLRVQRSIAGSSVLLPEGWQRGRKDFFFWGQKTNPNHQTWPDRTKRQTPTSTL